MYETSAGLPTQGLTYAKMLDHLREAQTCASLMSHLVRAEGTAPDEALANGWLLIEDLLNRIANQITALASGRLQ